MKTITQPLNSRAPSEPEPSPHVQARILAEALPHIIRYDDQTVVIKFGGHAMGDAGAVRRLRPGHRLPEAVGR